jgi:hypothetical protein
MSTPILTAGSPPTKELASRAISKAARDAGPRSKTGDFSPKPQPVFPRSISRPISPNRLWSGSYSRFGDSVWVFLKNAAVLTAKALTLIDLAGKLLSPLGQAVYRLLAIVPHLISPTAQILILFVSLAFLIAFICAFGKRFLAGEKT